MAHQREDISWSTGVCQNARTVQDVSCVNIWTERHWRGILLNLLPFCAKNTAKQNWNKLQPKATRHWKRETLVVLVGGKARRLPSTTTYRHGDSNGSREMPGVIRCPRIGEEKGQLQLLQTYEKTSRNPWEKKKTTTIKKDYKAKILQRRGWKTNTKLRKTTCNCYQRKSTHLAHVQTAFGNQQESDQT